MEAVQTKRKRIESDVEAERAAQRQKEDQKKEKIVMHPAFFALLTHSLFPLLYLLYFKTLHFSNHAATKEQRQRQQ